MHPSWSGICRWELAKSNALWRSCIKSRLCAECDKKWNNIIKRNKVKNKITINIYLNYFITSKDVQLNPRWHQWHQWNSTSPRHTSSMPTDNRTKSSKSHQDAPRCSVLMRLVEFRNLSELRQWDRSNSWNASNTCFPIQTFFYLKMIPTILPSQNCCCILLFPACAQCPVRGKCALFCRDGSVAHGTRHFAKTSEITISDAHWRHNMSPDVTRCHQERRTLHWEWHCSHFLGWPDCQDEILFISLQGHSLYLNRSQLVVPSVQKRRLFWRADWHPASAEKNRQNLPGTRNSYNWVSRTRSSQERNISKLDWSRIKILLRQS